MYGDILRSLLQTQKANEIYERVLHRLNGFLLDLTAVYGKKRLQVRRGILIFIVSRKLATAKVSLAPIAHPVPDRIAWPRTPWG
jgi:hypothetical protein